VRRQYHFWPCDNGFDAWDVERLIRLSAELPVIEVPLASMAEVDTVYWFDGKSEQPTVRKVVEHARLISEADTSYPVILGPDGRVMDGMHRIARLMLDGQATVKARQFDALPEPDYRDCTPDDLPS
jgi:hypothetical protein